MSPKRNALPAIAVAAVLVLAGCAGFAGQLDDDQQQQVADRLADRLQNLDGFEATVTMELETGDRSLTSEADVAVDLRTGEYRTETLEPEQNAGDVTVYNGSTMVSYDASENVYRTFEVEMNGPMVGSNLSDQFDQLAEETDIIYNGTETVDGTETYKATLVPTNESDSFVDSVTLWVETDRMVPVKMETKFATNDLTTTVTFSDVELDPEFEEGTFEFDPPADATYEDNVVKTETERYEDRDELAADVDLEIPPAELPEGFTFQEATVFVENSSDSVRTAMMEFSDGERSVRVSLSPASGAMEFGSENAEEVTVDGHDATYRTVGDSTGNVFWSCNGTEYVVFGDLEKSTLLSVADGVGC